MQETTVMGGFIAKHYYYYCNENDSVMLLSSI